MAISNAYQVDNKKEVKDVPCYWVVLKVYGVAYNPMEDKA